MILAGMFSCLLDKQYDSLSSFDYYRAVVMDSFGLIAEYTGESAVEYSAIVTCDSLRAAPTIVSSLAGRSS